MWLLWDFLFAPCLLAAGTCWLVYLRTGNRRVRLGAICMIIGAMVALFAGIASR